MSDVKWIKIAADMFDNRKIKQIRTLPDGDAIIVIWLQILCLAGQINNGGCVHFTKDLPYTDEMLATQFDRPVNTIRLALKTFEAYNMIEIVDNFLLVSNWEKYQSTDKLKQMQEQNRLRQQKFKEKQKLLPKNNVKVTLPVTLGNATDIDKDIDKEKNIKKEKPTKAALDDLLKNWTENAGLIKAFKDFAEMRASIKKPLTNNAAVLVMKKLDSWYKTIEDGINEKNKIKTLENSTLNSWQGVFELKPEQREKTQEEVFKGAMI